MLRHQRTPPRRRPLAAASAGVRRKTSSTGSARRLNPGNSARHSHFLNSTAHRQQYPLVQVGLDQYFGVQREPEPGHCGINKMPRGCIKCIRTSRVTRIHKCLSWTTPLVAFAAILSTSSITFMVPLPCQNPNWLGDRQFPIRSSIRLSSSLSRSFPAPYNREISL